MDLSELGYLMHEMFILIKLNAFRLQFRLISFFHYKEVITKGST